MGQARSTLVVLLLLVYLTWISQANTEPPPTTNPGGVTLPGTPQGALPQQPHTTPTQAGITICPGTKNEGEGGHQTPEELEAEEEEEEEKPSALLFMFISFAVGVACKRFLAGLPLPYTVLCFVFGLIVGQFSISFGDPFTKGIGSGLAQMDPELMLYVFLPVLIFESAFGMNTYVFKLVFWQCLILAGPGLLVASALTAIFTKYAMYNSWTWIKVLLFGSLLSATDPVAVVALLKDLGADEKISTLIEGESLLNDGAAIVCFQILRSGIITNKVDEWYMILLSFCRLGLGGPLFGYVCGRLTVYVFKYTFNDPLVEVTITLSGAYLTYYIGDGLLGVSGVLCLVAFGVTLSARQSSISPEVHHFMHEFWGLAVYLANTLIFVLVGVQTRNAFSSGVEGIDVLKLLLLYIAINCIRFFVLLIFYPILNFKIFKYRLDWKNTMLVGWGGLRGAVGIALALNIQNHKALAKADPLMGGRVAFHVSGIVLLTIMINGISTGKLVNMLGLSALTTDQLVNMKRVYRDLQRHFHKKIRVLQTDPLVADANWLKVKQATVGGISNPYTPAGADTSTPNDAMVLPTPYDAEELARLACIRCFSNAVFEQYEAGLLQDASVRRLTLYVERAREERAYLDYEAFAAQFLEPSKAGKLPCLSSKTLNQFIFHAYDSGAGWVHGHEEVLHKLDTIAPNRKVQEDVRRQILTSINYMREKMRRLSVSAPGSANSIKTKFAARHVLNSGRQRVNFLAEEGLLCQADAAALIGQIEQAMNLVKKFPRSMPHPMPESVLQDVPWFQREAPSIQEKLLTLHPDTLNEGYALVELNTVVDGAAIVVQGMLQTETEDGQQFYLGPGRTANLYTCLTGLPSRERVIAKSFVKFFWMEKEDVLSLIEESPTLADEFWRLTGTRVAATLLLTDMPFSMWGLQKTFELCEDGHILDLMEAEHNQVVYLYPQNEYVLLHGHGLYSTGGAVTGPCWLRQNNAVAKNESQERMTEIKTAFTNFCTLKRGFQFKDQDPIEHGILDETALQRALNQLGLSVSYGEIRQLFVEDDKDSSGFIDFHEFRTICNRISVSFTPGSKVLAIPRYHREEEEAPDGVEDEVLLAVDCGSENMSGKKSPTTISNHLSNVINMDVYGDSKGPSVNKYGNPVKSSYYTGVINEGGSHQRFNGVNGMHPSLPTTGQSNGMYYQPQQQQHRQQQPQQQHQQHQQQQQQPQQQQQQQATNYSPHGSYQSTSPQGNGTYHSPQQQQQQQHHLNATPANQRYSPHLPLYEDGAAVDTHTHNAQPSQTSNSPHPSHARADAEILPPANTYHLYSPTATSSHSPTPASPRGVPPDSTHHSSQFRSPSSSSAAPYVQQSTPNNVSYTGESGGGSPSYGAQRRSASASGYQNDPMYSPTSYAPSSPSYAPTGQQQTFTELAGGWP